MFKKVRDYQVIPQVQKEIAPPVSGEVFLAKDGGDGKAPASFWLVDEATLLQLPQGMCYEIAIDTFFNARHSVVIENRKGLEHTHSYRLQVRGRALSLVAQDQVIVGYQDLRQRIKQVVGAYNNRFLNTLPPFRDLQPTTENLTAVLFHQLNRSINGLPIELISVTVWDSPTEAITIGKMG